ncbi:unnamed protein product [Cunninghamella blakesleeana]
MDIYESVRQSYSNNDSKKNAPINNNDPYRGNSLAIGSINNISYVLFPGGNSLCQLVINEVDKQPIQLQAGFQQLNAINMPVGFMSNRVYFSLNSPILQIQISNAKNTPKDSMIIGVRTLLSCFIIKIYQNKDKTLNIFTIHECKADRSLKQSCYFNKMTMCLSPFNINQYIVIGDNESLLFIDIPRATRDNPNGAIYEMELNISNVDDVQDNVWKSCVFGPHPYSLIIASKKKVEYIDFRPSAVLPRYTLFECNENDQIYALGKIKSKNSYQYSISTEKLIHLLDVRYPNQPVISWNHQSMLDPPTFIEMISDLFDQNTVNIFCWSIETDTITQLQYKYSGRLEYCEEGGAPYIKPAVYSLPQYFPIKQLTMRSLGQSYIIPIIGMHFYSGILKSDNDDSSTNQVLLLYRLLNDGSIVLNDFYYLDKSLLNEHIAMMPVQFYAHNDNHHVNNNHDLKQIIEIVENMKIDEKYNRNAKWNSRSFFDYVINMSYISGISNSSDDNIDINKLPEVPRNKLGNMIELLGLDLKRLIHLDRFLLDDLNYIIMEQHFYQPKPHILSRSEFPIPNHASIYDLSLESAKKSVTNRQKFDDRQEKVRENNINNFAKDMFCNAMYYLPKPNIENNNSEQLQYLNIDESICLKKKNGKTWSFQPTLTTQMFAQEWIPGQLDYLKPPKLSDFIEHESKQPLFYTHKPGLDLEQNGKNMKDRSSKFFSTSLDATSFTTFMDEQDESKSQLPPSVVPIVKLEVKDKGKEPLPNMNIATQPEPGAFGNRIKLNPAKKKKKKTLGFK